MAKRPSAEPRWCVRWLLKGRALFEVQVQAASEERAVRVAESSEGKVRRNQRLLADKVEVKRMQEPEPDGRR